MRATQSPVRRAATRPNQARGTWKLPAFSGLAALVVFAIAWYGSEVRGLRHSAEAAFPISAGAIVVPGLSSRVELLRDGRGIPHIRAEREADGWLALGFAHAQDRLAQMLWLRRLARGRTAEVVGGSGLEADRLARTLAIGSHADAEATRLDPETRDILAAYATGINSRIDRIRAGLVAPPREIGAASDLTEPWKPADSLAIVKLMAWSAGPAPETAAVLRELIERLGAVAARPFMPTGLGVRGVELANSLPASDPSDQADGTPERSWDGTSRQREQPDVPSRSRNSSAETTLADAWLGSTAYVVSGRHTRSGAPILSVDFHLPPTAPSLLYEARLHAGDLEVAGATVPGVPVFWAGRNAKVAWAATPARVVTTDLYRETPNPEHPDEYRHGRRWLKTQERIEAIEVEGFGQPRRRETLRVVETRHGPIVNELIGRSGDSLALAWSGALPGNGVRAMIGVARAADEGELRRALRDHHEPVIALLYAEAGGTAGLQVAGWIPSRRVPTGLLPVPGRHTVFDWRGPLKPEQLPHRLLEEGEAWLVASDGPLIEALGGRIEWMWRTGEAAARLESSLEAISRDGDLLEMDDLLNLRTERPPLPSPHAVAALLRLAGERETLGRPAREVADSLADWDDTTDPSGRGAAVVHLVFHYLTRELFAGPLGAGRLQDYLALSHTRPQAITERVVLAAATSPGGSGWRDPERVRIAIRASLGLAANSLALRVGSDSEQWTWDRLAQLAFRPFAGGRARSGPANDPRGTTLQFTGVGSLALMSPTDPFEVKAATIHRLAIDLGSQDAILSVVAPGQSEHPHHRHFDDGIASLQQVETQGAMNRRPSQKAEVEVRDTELRLVLEPGGSVRSAPTRQAVETASAASVTRTVGRVPTVETTTP